MYLNKFSSGTILALLALSGILFLVPFAAPAQATTNASLPTLSLNHNLVVGGAHPGLTITVANPTTNAYEIDSITVTAPASWNFTSSSPTVTCSNGAAVVSLTAISCPTINILPGFSGTITIAASGSSGIDGPTVASGASPTLGTFSTSLVDGGSSPAAYTGPQFQMWSIITFAGNPTVATSSTNFVAGSAPVTITATVPSTEPGVPVTFTTTAGTLSSSTASTSSTGVASVTFSPPNTAGSPSATVTATVGTLPSGSPAGSVSINTLPATPSKITFTVGSGAFPSVYYIGAGSSPSPVTYSTGPVYANIPSDTFNYAITDAFGNTVSSGLSGVSGKFTSTNGFFDDSTTTVTSPTYSSLSGSVTDSYQQSSVYATIGLITGTFSGYYTPTGGSEIAFSVSGSTGNLQTSVLGSISSFQVYASVSGTWTAGASSAGAGLYASPDLTLSVDQAGVPVTLMVCQHTEAACATGTTSGYSGTFAANGLQAITVTTSATSPSAGNASAHFNVDTTLNHQAVFNATVTDPINGTPTHVLKDGPTSPAVVTTAGAASQFKVSFELVKNAGPNAANIVVGGTGYVSVYTADKYGNIVKTGLSQQVQINLASSTGALSVQSAYIPAGDWNTNGTGSFGTISWTLPNTVGTVGTLTVSGVLSGASTSTPVTVTTVSPLPWLSVSSPKPVSNVIYSASSAVVFTGRANVSVGYPGSSSSCAGSYVCISSIGYKIGTGKWQPATVTPGNTITWSLAATMPTGLSTIWFNATDSKSNVVVSPAYTVLVDNQPPTFTIGTPVSGQGSDTVTIKTAEGDFNTSTFVATYGSTTVPSSSISWSGTQTVGSPSTLTATINGLTTGTNTLSVSGSTYTGEAGSASSSITITIVFADSVTFTTASATWGSSGAAQGIFVPVTNSWSSSQQLTLYATLKSGNNVYVLVGGESLAAGQTGTVFLQDFLVTVPAGTYTVTFSAITTANQAVSAPTTPITVTVP